MKVTRHAVSILIGSLVLAMLGGCAPKVGSDAWCSNMKEKDKADWTLQEAADYAKHCLVR